MRTWDCSVWPISQCLQWQQQQQSRWNWADAWTVKDKNTHKEYTYSIHTLQRSGLVCCRDKQTPWGKIASVRSSDYSRHKQFNTIGMSIDSALLYLCPHSSYYLWLSVSEWGEMFDVLHSNPLKHTDNTSSILVSHHHRFSLPTETVSTFSTRLLVCV